MSPIFWWLSVSLKSYKSKCSKRRDRKNGMNGLERYHSKVPLEAPGIASPTDGGCDSVEGCGHSLLIDLQLTSNP